jgi:MazG family protein
MPDTAAEQFQRLVDVVATLRSPQGCPWDRAQTLHSLRPFVLEETYEVLEAIEQNDPEALNGEIGDLLFEGVLLAQVASEAGDFSIADALRSITDKLIRRHPHVFGLAECASSPDEVLGLLEGYKAKERAASDNRDTTLSGIPKTLPALLRAHEIGSRAAAVGFDWTHAADVLAKIEEEVAELRRAVEQEHDRTAERTEEEMGDLLFALANLSRKLGVEPEAALRRADDKFTRRFDHLERRLLARGLALPQATLGEMEEEWGRIKEAEDGS